MQEQSLLATCGTLTDYLMTLGPGHMGRLYRHPATCLAVFRELPQLARLYVMRLLFLEQPVPSAVIMSWVNSQLSSSASKSSNVLSKLNIWVQESTQGMPSWRLDPTFKQNLTRALMGGGEPWTMSAMIEPDPYARDVAYLDQYAQERWNTVLHYMVGSKREEGISVDAVRILVCSNLVVLPEGGEVTAPSITRSGFQFLLMDTPSQVWYFILQYLNTVDSLNMDLAECLNFLFQLSFAELGKDYSTAGLTETLLSFLQHLREFGLVYQRKRSAGRFYPTRLALNIASGEKKSLMEQHREGYLVVETNYRVYAYTISDLQVSLLGLFAEVLYRFPNFAVAVITRDSVRTAFRGGITATQIVRFLQMHCHSRQVSAAPTSSKSAIPPTVIDQIYLWEQERNRFEFTEGVLYNQFLSQGDFETVKNYAENLGVCVWSNSRNRTVVVTKEGHDSVKKFWRRHSRGGD